MNQRGNASLILIGIVAFLLLIGTVMAAGTVPAGGRGVVLRWGAVTGEVKGEGLYFVTPFKYGVQTISVQTKKYEVEADASSQDLQEVHAKVAVIYHFDPGKVTEIWQRFRHDYEIRVIVPEVQEAVKASTALFRAESLITERPKVKDRILNDLKTRLAPFVVVESVAIVDFGFSKAFDEAIEAKVTAQQKALEAERNLDRVRFEAQQKIEQAKAEAESLRLQKQNITPDLLQLRWIEKWNGELPQTMIGQGVVPIFDVTKK